MTELEQYKRALGIMHDALCQYADPEFYHAILFLVDRPAGGFADDVSEVDPSYAYNRPMPGKLARDTLDKMCKDYGDLQLYTTEGED